METEYRINGSQIEYGTSWTRKWPKKKFIHRIECRNGNLFGEQVVWTQEFDKSMDVDPKKFVVPVEKNKNAFYRETYNPDCDPKEIKEREARRMGQIQIIDVSSSSHASWTDSDSDY